MKKYDPMVFGDAAAPAGEPTFVGLLPANAPEELEEQEREHAARAAYGETILLARDHIENGEPEEPDNWDSSIKPASYYYRQIKKLLEELDQATIDVLDGRDGRRLKMAVDRMQQRTVAIGALYAECTALGALKPDRDQQIQNRQKRSRERAEANRESAKLTEHEKETIRYHAARVPGSQSMTKKELYQQLLTHDKVRHLVDGLTPATFNRALGQEFGERKKSKR